MKRETWGICNNDNDNNNNNHNNNNNNNNMKNDIIVYIVFETPLSAQPRLVRQDDVCPKT